VFVFEREALLALETQTLMKHEFSFLKRILRTLATFIFVVATSCFVAQSVHADSLIPIGNSTVLPSGNIWTIRSGFITDFSDYNYNDSSVLGWSGYTFPTTLNLQATLQGSPGTFLSGYYTLQTGTGALPVNPDSYGYFYWDGVDVTAFVSDFSDEIVSIDSPIGTIASTTIDFSFTVDALTADSLVVSLQNFDTGILLDSIEIPITTNGYQQVSTTTVLSQGLYWGIVSLRANETFFTSKNFQFTVLSSSGDLNDYLEVMTASSSTEPFCSDPSNILVSFGCFMVKPSPSSLSQFYQLPTLMNNKIPFVYYYDIKNIIASSSLSSATSSLGTASLVSASSSPISYNIPIFSPTLLRRFIPDSLAEIFRTLLTASVWIGVGYCFWKRIPTLLHSKQ